MRLSMSPMRWMEGALMWVRFASRGRIAFRGTFWKSIWTWKCFLKFGKTTIISESPVHAEVQRLSAGFLARLFPAFAIGRPFVRNASLRFRVMAGIFWPAIHVLLASWVKISKNLRKNFRRNGKTLKKKINGSWNKQIRLRRTISRQAKLLAKWKRWFRNCGRWKRKKESGKVKLPTKRRKKNNRRGIRFRLQTWRFRMLSMQKKWDSQRSPIFVTSVDYLIFAPRSRRMV